MNFREKALIQIGLTHCILVTSYMASYDTVNIGSVNDFMKNAKRRLQNGSDFVQDSISYFDWGNNQVPDCTCFKLDGISFYWN